MTQPIDYQAQPRPAPGNPRRSVFGWVLFIGLAVMLFMLLNHRRDAYQALPLSEFRVLLQEGHVAAVNIEGDAVYGQLRPNPRTQIINFRTELPQGTASNWMFTQWLLDNRGGATVAARNETNLLLQVLLPLIPWLLIFGFIWFFVFRQLRKGTLRHEPMRVVVVGQETQATEAGVS